MNLPVCPACQLVPQATILTFVNSRNSCLGNVHLVEEDFAGIERHARQQCVAHGARLLEDFLLHEMLEAALFRHDGVPGNVLDGALDGVSVQVHYAHALRE